MDGQQMNKWTSLVAFLLVLLFAAALLVVQGVFSACAVRYTRRLSLVERIKALD